MNYNSAGSKTNFAYLTDRYVYANLRSKIFAQPHYAFSSWIKKTIT